MVRTLPLDELDTSNSFIPPHMFLVQSLRLSIPKNAHPNRVWGIQIRDREFGEERRSRLLIEKGLPRCLVDNMNPGEAVSKKEAGLAWIFSPFS